MSEEPSGRHADVLRSEFERAAPTFTDRTRGRFDHLEAVAFSRVGPGATVLEVGAGTGHFISRFAGQGRTLVAADLIPAMLVQARIENLEMHVVVADGARVPIADRSVDLCACAQMLHHVWEPIPLLTEMKRVTSSDGHVLVVDQSATERFEEIVAMTALETLRDPSHAASRPPPAFRLMLRYVGLEVVDEKLTESEQRLSSWMWPGEFPEDRIEAVRRFIAERGSETGMGFERDGDDWVFVRRRIMLLARRVLRR
ncbi:MAG: class I SAM-dependent methyltransferase [Actinomycetota bacterium]|nr:class I SAM-dependent methyltransferase [Actinomycetota bacterium]